MVQKSLRGVLALGGLHAGGVLAMGGDPVVVFSVGGASYIFGPGVAGAIVQVPIDAERDLADIDEVSLEQGPVRGNQISCVKLGGFKDVDAPPILECFGDRLGGPAVDGFLSSGPAGNNLVF